MAIMIFFFNHKMELEYTYKLKWNNFFLNLDVFSSKVQTFRLIMEHYFISICSIFPIIWSMATPISTIRASIVGECNTYL